jgi:hypothetical protein
VQISIFEPYFSARYFIIFASTNPVIPMKRSLLTLLIGIFALTICLGQTSQIGKWSRFDKDKFYLDLSKIDLSAFGDKKDIWLECYFNRLQNNYASYSEANADEEGCKMLAFACNDEVLGCESKKGKWSQTDKDAFYDAMKDVDLSSLKKNKQKKWLDCYFNKVQDNYVSFNVANADFQGCEMLATECIDEVLK